MITPYSSSDDSTPELKIKKKCVPTQTQIREQLGSRLSDVFFENLSAEARLWLGLEEPLVGPGPLWVDPESRLEQKAILTPLPEPSVAYLKAFTHEGVLEVGGKYIQLLENKHRKEMEAALKLRDEEWEKKLENQCALKIEEDQSQTQKIIATMMEHFDICFEELVKSTQLRMRKECQKRIYEERSEVASYMLMLLQEEVENRDYELCNEFHDILHSELNMLASRYVRQINDERKTAVCLMQKTVRKYEQMLRELKMKMEFSTVVDICRAITNERVECNERLRKMREELRFYKDQVKKSVVTTNTKNNALQNMANDRLKRLVAWRQRVRILLQEFQKFINFALKAVPGQSEYLLSFEKLLLKKCPEECFATPEDYVYFKSCVEGKEPSLALAEEPEVRKLTATKDDYIGPEEVQQEKEDEEEGEGEEEDIKTSKCSEKKESKTAFNYYKFKSKLIEKFAKDLIIPVERKKKPKKDVCKLKKKSKEEPVNENDELYEALTLVGEKEKEHLVPAECFLDKTLNTVFEICQDDPEFTKIMLGCKDQIEN